MSIGNTGRALTSDGLQEIVWDLIPASPQTAHMHMALDEVVLERVIAGERRPTVRFWKWIERTLVIGSHQSVMNEVDDNAARRLGFTVTRRMTGGGTMLCEPERTITYSLYLPGTAVAGMSFRRSYAVLDAWAVRAFNGLGIPASYREINDIISPRGKIAGTRSADAAVSPLSWFTSLRCAEVTQHLERSFANEFRTRPSELSALELTAAEALAASKYSTPAWVNRLP